VFGGTATIKNSTIALNSVRGVSPSSGGTTDAEGGGIFLDNTNPNTLTNVTVAGNRASGSGGSHIVRAGGLDAGDKTKIKDTILGPNSAPAAPDCRTGIKSGGYNVIRHTSGCAFASGAGDKLNKSPKLGLLKNNGGPTQTMLIKSSSPAHNAVPNTAARCPNKSDQRGVHRPQGTRCDIGAVERKSSDPPSAPLSVPRVHVAHRPSTGAGAPPAISRILSRILGSVPGGSDGLLQGSSSGPSFAQMARAALARL
jgi:hypothetical protein